MNEVRRDIRIRIKTDSLNIGSGKQGGVITDRHRAESQRAIISQFDLFAVGSRTKAMISPFSIRGWLEHGVQSYLLNEGISVCTSVTDEVASAVGGGKTKIEKDKELGYHPKGECIKNDKEGKGCLVAQIFGTLVKPSLIRQNPFIIHPTSGDGKKAIIDGKGGYGNFRVHYITPCNRAEREPYLPTEVEMIAFVDGALGLKINKKVDDEMAKVINGLFIKAVEYLNSNRDEFEHQLGGKRNFGSGIIQCEIINPLYDDDDLDNLFGREVAEEIEVGEKIEETGAEGKAEKQEIEKQKKLSKLKKKDDDWNKEKEVYLKALKEEIEKQKQKFPKK